MQKKKEIWMLQTKRADFNGLAMRLGVSPVAVRIMRNRGLLDEREMRISPVSLMISGCCTASASVWWWSMAHVRRSTQIWLRITTNRYITRTYV